MSSITDDTEKLIRDQAGDGEKSNPGTVISSDEPTDRQPGQFTEDVNIPDDELQERVLEEWKNEIIDKDESGWKEKRQYDDRAYYEVEDQFFKNWPWPNASAFNVSMTQVFVDTLLATIDDYHWRNADKKIVTVSPVGDEDLKKSKNLETLLNWQGIHDIEDFQQEDSASNFYAIQKGTGFLKVLDVAPEGKFRLGAFNVKPEYIYIPVGSKGTSIGKAEAVTHLIPLSSNDMRSRLASRKYRNLDKVGRGFLPNNLSAEELHQMEKDVSGLDKIQNNKRSTWWICERYWTYYPKGSIRAKELIVWFSPMTGAILRKIENKDGIRPIIDKYIYENYDSPFHRSLPEKIRPIQEKANYTDKQATDGADKAIHRAGFYTGTSGFDPKLSLRVPLGMYKVKNLGTIQWEPIDMSVIMAQRQELVRLWLDAERVSGVTDLQQGVVSRNTAPTLGQDVMRSNKADVRASKILRNVTRNWKRVWETIYRYDDLHMPRDTKIKVLGVKKYPTVESLFPLQENTQVEKGLGLKVNFDFGIANKPIQQQEADDQKRSIFMGEIIQDQRISNNMGVLYKAYEQRGEANGIFDFESVVPRPAEANILTPDEVVNAIMDGEEVAPSQDMNPIDYIVSIKSFMRTGNFNDADLKTKQNMAKFLLIMEAMRKAQLQAFKSSVMMDAMRGLSQEPQKEEANKNGTREGVQV